MSCAACFTGSPQTGTPKGTYTFIHGYKTYTANPAEPHPSGSTILYLPDFFSHRLINNQLLCDRYADLTGCTVVFPDIVRNGGVDPSWIPIFEVILGEETVPWYTKLLAYVQFIPLLPQMIFGTPMRRFAEVLRYARAVRAKMPPGAKLGVAGFCWGGHGSTHLCKEMAVEGGEDRLIDAHFAGHPSMLDTPNDIVLAVGSGVPYSVAVAEIDFMFDEKQALEVEAELRRVYGESGKGNATWELKIHKGAFHGFCVRAREGVKADQEGCEAALEQAAEWFRRYLL